MSRLACFCGFYSIPALLLAAGLAFACILPQQKAKWGLSCAVISSGRAVSVPSVIVCVFVLEVLKCELVCVRVSDGSSPMLSLLTKFDWHLLHLKSLLVQTRQFLKHLNRGYTQL